MVIVKESLSGMSVLAKIMNKEVCISRHAYNQILNKIWSIKLENNELIIYDENNIEIDRF